VGEKSIAGSRVRERRNGRARGNFGDFVFGIVNLNRYGFIGFGIGEGLVFGIDDSFVREALPLRLLVGGETAVARARAIGRIHDLL